MAAGKIAVLFPGQGSQFVGMGQEFLAADPEAQAFLAVAEKVSGFPLGRLCLEGPITELSKAVHLQPAFTAINLISWLAVKKAGVVADYFAGHSLGEYSALCAAGVLSLEDAMRLVTERGRLMQREGELHPGGMRAVLGLTLAEVAAELSGLEQISIGNHNSEKQVVLSGAFPSLDLASERLATKGGKVIPLPVTVANHSPLVAGAVADFARVMAATTFHKPATPIFFNATATREEEPELMRRIMARQISSMVRWFEIVNQLVALDVRVFIEVGPKAVLTGLMKRILPRGDDYQCYQVESPATLAACLEGMAK